MRFIQIKGVGGFLSPQQKTELISEITNVVDAVYGEGLRQATRVAIEEIPSGSAPDHLSPKRTSGGSPASN